MTFNQVDGPEAMRRFCRFSTFYNCLGCISAAGLTAQGFDNEGHDARRCTGHTTETSTHLDVCNLRSQFSSQDFASIDAVFTQNSVCLSAWPRATHAVQEKAKNRGKADNPCSLSWHTGKLRQTGVFNVPGSLGSPSQDVGAFRH